MKHFFIFVILSLIMIGCSQDEPILVPNVSEQSAKTNAHRVSLHDALNRADALLSQIGDPTTRSKTRKVKSVEYLTNTLTRSGAIDTTLYLVNYENNGGFALLGADKRVRPIYAISDKGRLFMSDTIENKGLALFFRNTEAEITNTSLIPEIEDSLIYIGPPGIEPPYHEVVVYRQVEPLLGAYQRIWDQGYPYNIYCPNNSVVGCTALGVAQVMSYYQWPISIGTETFPWATMNIGRSDERIAKLLAIIGGENNLGTNYGTTISYANTENCIRTFVNLGYLHPGNWKSFNENAVTSILMRAKSNLTGGGPVLISGWELVNNMLTNGHTWVIDGFVQYKTVSNQIVGGETIHDILYHCVWGWSGASNGYFYWAQTNSFSGNPIEDDDNSGNMTIPNLNEVKYLGGFIPNR